MFLPLERGELIEGGGQEKGKRKEEKGGKRAPTMSTR